MSPIDITGGIIIIFMALRGWGKGLIKDSRKKAGIIVGILSGIMFTSPLRQIVNVYVEKYNLGNWLSVGTFVLSFAAGFIFIVLMLGVINDGLEASHLSWLDRLVGFAFGAIEGTAICTVILYIMRFQKVFDLTELLSSSLIVDYLTPIILFLVKFSIKDQLVNIL